MKKIILQIKSAEGGNDSKLLVNDMCEIYKKTCILNKFKIYSIQKTDSSITLCIDAESKKFFLNEVGGHRFQRIPPTESKGRVHTSTITISVIDEDKNIGVELDMNEIDIFYTRGTGNGGQHKNTTNSCVVVRHISGIEVRIDGRNQHKNKKDALKELQRRLDEKYKKETQNDTWNNIKEQVGSGMRGDKRRTYRIRDNRVHDHITGKKSQWKKIQKGEIDLLH